MKVYLLVLEHLDGTDVVVKVYLDKDKAFAECEKRNSHINFYDIDYYAINEWDVTE